MPNIPKDPNDWNIQVIDSLLLILSIEGDTFDFKGNILDKRFEEIYNDFCAMSNSLGGTMVLGIREDKAPDGTLIRFAKEGFDIGEEDIVNQKIASSLHNVEPVSTASTRLVTDSNQNKFYPVIQIMMIDTNKPYFTKNRGQCYIRVGNTNQIASRGVILNLQRNLMDRVKSVQRLQVAVKFFKESFMLTVEELENVDPDGIQKIPLVDLRILVESIISNEWLLLQKGLLGGHMDNNFNSQTIGTYSHLRELEKLNTYLSSYNTESDISKKIAIKRYLCDSQFWCPERQQARTIIGFLDSLNCTSEEYLSSLNST